MYKKDSTENLVVMYREVRGLEKEVILSEILKRTEPAFYKMSAMYSNIPNTEDEDRRGVMTIAFLKALDTFDVERGFKFSTVCRNYFEQALNKLWRDNRREKRCVVDEEGSLIKDLSYEELVEHGVDREANYLSGEMEDFSLVEIQTILENAKLTDKEKLTCKYIMMDRNNKEIAKKLEVSNVMVGYYIKNIRKKFLANGLDLSYVK